jgi:hypothetical protein
MNKKQTGLLITGILTLVILFQLLVLTGVIPYAIVWGGRLSSDSQMVQFVSASIFTNSIFIGIVLIKIQVIAIKMKTALINGLLWVMILIYLLNTIGNLMAKTELEKYIFTPLTLLLAILLFRLVRDNK